MSWFRNYYRCDDCGATWEDEWSCTCDDDCPTCGARHMSPGNSDDLTLVIEETSGTFMVIRSPDSAEDSPDYEVVSKFPTLELAEACVQELEET